MFGVVSMQHERCTTLQEGRTQASCVKKPAEQVSCHLSLQQERLRHSQCQKGRNKPKQHHLQKQFKDGDTSTCL